MVLLSYRNLRKASLLPLSFPMNSQNPFPKRQHDQKWTFYEITTSIMSAEYRYIIENTTDVFLKFQVFFGLRWKAKSRNRFLSKYISNSKNHLNKKVHRCWIRWIISYGRVRWWVGSDECLCLVQVPKRAERVKNCLVLLLLIVICINFKGPRFYLVLENNRTKFFG